MTVIRSLNFVLGIFLLLSPLALSQTFSDCHPYPGAAASDCLQLIGNHLNNDTELACASTSLTTITLGSCSVTTKCGSGTTTITPDDAVRRALTVIGKCALSDHGSISGWYLTEDGTKTCYLYPGK